MGKQHEGDAALEEYFEGLKHFFEERIRFNALLRMKVEHLGPGTATLRVPYFDDLVGDPFRPALHGGVVSTLVDTVGGMAAFTAVRPGDRVATVDLRVDYLLPAAPADLIGEAKIVRIGNRVAVCDMLVHQGDPQRHVATGKGVYNVTRRARATS
jgi:uncharacterized protein (TIGR00369 family)